LSKPTESRENHVGRFFVDILGAPGEPVCLSGREAAHAFGSRRARVGDAATLFDGSGWTVEARITGAGREGVVFEEISRRFAGSALAVPVTCATALPKGARADDLVAKCAQIGVSRLVPVDFERSAVKARDKWANRRERFRRLAVEAAKQCGSAVLMEIGEPVELAGLAREAAGGLRLVGLPEAGSGVLGTLLERWPFEGVTFLVGPEGGLAESEGKSVTDAGFLPVSLGATILRIETACMAFAALSAAFITEHKT
jgi:16S rRNA (uracil1498-N3)-methyltransferase